MKKKPRHPLGPAPVWRKCYTIHPLVRGTEPVAKTLFLTHSQLLTHVPQPFKVFAESLPMEKVVPGVRRSLVQSLVHHKERSLEHVYVPSLTLSFLMPVVFQHVWRLSEFSSSTAPWYWTYKPHLESYWYREGRSFLFKTPPACLLRSRTPLMPLVTGEAQEEAYKQSLRHTVDYRMMTIPLFRRSVDNLDVYPGFKLGTKSKHSHTLVLVDKRQESHEQRIATGLRYLYGQLHAQVLNERIGRLDLTRKVPPAGGFKARGERLNPPRVLQGMLTDGRRFTFMWLQMEATAPEKGAYPNLVWATKDMDLFDSCDEEGVHGLDEETLRYITAMLLMPTQPERVQGSQRKEKSVVDKDEVETAPGEER